MNSSQLRVFENVSEMVLPLAEGLGAVDLMAVAAGHPEGWMVVVDGREHVTAMAALWWREVPKQGAERLGVIGGFQAVDEEAARFLLDGAVEYLGKCGCERVVGPMDGNTWRRHRYVVESAGRGVFLLEPKSPVEYPAWWRGAGFSVLSEYSSSLIPLDGSEACSVAVKLRLEKMGVVVRSLDLDAFDEELERIYEVSLKSFSGNFLYTPLERDAFFAAYRNVRERVDGDLVKLAEKDGAVCGFVFGISDFEAVARGEKPAVIVKTLAVDPAARCGGLGSLMVDELHRAAREKGYVEAIHALQHASNTSLKITGRHHGEVFRRYALFSKVI